MSHNEISKKKDLQDFNCMQ